MTIRQDEILLRGVNEAQLSGADLRIPLGCIVCLSGSLGSGVEVLARRVLLAESRRRYLLSMSPFERASLGGVDAAADVDDIDGLPPARALPGSPADHVVASRLQLFADLTRVVRERSEIRCGACGGLCAAVDEEGVTALIQRLFADQTCWVVAPMQLADAGAAAGVIDELGRAGFRRLRVDGEAVRVDGVDPLSLDGRLEVIVDRLAPGARSHSRVGEAVRSARAIAGGANLLVGEQDSRERWVGQRLTCGRCGTQRDEPQWDSLLTGQGEAADVLVGDRPLHEMAPNLLLGQLPDMLEGVAESLPDCARRLRQTASLADDLGLASLPILRPLRALSHGEQLLLSVAAGLVGGLSGILHVVMSPPSALDPATEARVAGGLRRLVEAGNSVVVVDAGPSAQAWADEVIVLGDPDATADVEPRRPAVVDDGEPLRLELLAEDEDGETGNGVALSIPLGRLVLLTGSTGAGKSVVLQRIAVGLSKKQQPRGRRVRAPAIRRCVDVSVETSAPAGERIILMEWLGALAPVARLLSRSPAAKELEFGPESFQLERPGGRCTLCEGRGVIRHRLDVLEDLAVVCPRCEGRRYRDEVMQVTGRGVNITEILAMRVGEAAAHFQRERGVHGPLAAAVSCGLETRLLGVGVDDLEPAERSLARLARHSVAARPGDLFLVDRPVAGCQGAVADRVLGALRRLVDAGASVVIADGSGRLEDSADVVMALSSPLP